MENNSVQSDLILGMAEYLQQNVTFFADFDIGDFRQSGPRIALDIQAMEKRKRYYNGRTRQWYQFKILAKSESWKQDTDFLENSVNKLEKATSVNIKSQGGFFNFISAEASSSVGYQGSMVDSGGNSGNTEYVVYSVLFTVQATI